LRRLGPALEERDFRLWWLALLGMGISLQMIEVAIGWEVYALHRSALDLGWIGLAEFVPLFVLALPAGQLADRVPRRLIFAGALLLSWPSSLLRARPRCGRTWPWPSARESRWRSGGRRRARCPPHWFPSTCCKTR
jgi:hypothetical protein